MQQPHRPGPLHQTNKPHKTGRHSRKSSAVSEIKNKVISKSNTRQLMRDERLNIAHQNRKLKWEKSLSEKRSIGTASQAPLVLGVLGDPQNFLAGLQEAQDGESLNIKHLNERSLYVVANRLKMRFKLVMLDQENFDETLDLVKTLDIIVLLHQIEDIEEGNDMTALDLLQVVYIHCMPTLFHVIDGYNKIDKSQMIKVKRMLKARVGEEKMYAIESAQDYNQFFHIAGSCKRQRSIFKEARPAVASDRVETVDGCLAFSGFVRYKTLNPNCLIHIQGFDDYQISKIDVFPDIVSVKASTHQPDEIIQTLVPDPMRQETLEQENELDPMDGEQTWPTAEELAAEVERRNLKKVRKMLPPGTSEYQGAWIPESDEEEDSFTDESDEDESNGNDADMQPAEEVDSDNEMKQSEMDETETVGGGDDNVSMMDIDEYDKKYHNEKEMNILEKLRQARMEEIFPDEVDTPLDETARSRFARYRGLKSFRTSAWDPQENLPPDYSRIFQFQNFHHTKRRVLTDEAHDGARPGLYVRVHLANVPQDVIAKILAKPVVPNLICLLKHERKMTVMNLLIKRLPNSDLENPIKAKEELLFYVGYRKFKAQPLFTNHTIASKYKYERFLRDDVAMVATVYAPVTFPPAPVLVFRPKKNGEKELVASGSVLDSNPNRLIIKRIRLSAHPYKIHSKTAVLRFMFFNSEDVLYFKPVELITKYNRRGHITEPLGTHGHMKCTFDKKIRSDDCIFMNLYKRVFPKWTYKPVCEV